tara:strand:+ start:856 stop:1071 length:216 start_codon:yes stop_codon:yes gene_type:complete
MTYNKNQLRDFARLYGDYCEDQLHFDLAENQDTINLNAKYLRESYDKLMTAQEVYNILLISPNLTFDKTEK